MALLLTLVFGLNSCSKATEAPSTIEEPAPVPVPIGEIDAAATGGGDLGYGDDARLFDSAAAAVAEILEDKPRIIGFGEFHKLSSSAPVRSALRRFADEIFDVVGPGSAHLVLETWRIDPSCGKQAQEVTRKVEKAIERPKETENEMQILMRKAQAFGTAGHVLQFSCKEYGALLKDDGLDTEALLTSVSAKLGDSATRALAETPADKMVAIYGGATHNDLFPYAGLEAWSYAPALAEAVAGYVEIDLYVPELVEGDALLAQEAWYPLLAQAREDKVILIRRDPRSYILIMRKAVAEDGLADGQNDGEQAKKNQEGSSQDARSAD